MPPRLPICAQQLFKGSQKSYWTSCRRNLPKTLSLPSASICTKASSSRPLLYLKPLRLNPVQARKLNCSVPLRASTPPANATSEASRIVEPAAMSIDDYHEYADEYLDTLVSKLEDIGETKLDLDVEYSSGVLNCVFPPKGTYVLNKQPPNKQIWLSSPISGPKRYDYVVDAGSADTVRHGEEAGGEGKWVYLRDGSRLTDLLKEELGVDMES